MTSHAMKLYITTTSPYARLVRIVILEKALQERIEIIVAKTRTTNSLYYAINPSGRVPFLMREDGIGLEDSALICAYLDQLDGRPMFTLPAGEQGWEARRLEAMARSTLDGIAVWGREFYRPENERSPTVIEHEIERNRRMLFVWEDLIEHPMMQNGLNMAQLTLLCGLHLDVRVPRFQWRTARPKLADWADRLAERPSIAATMPPART